MKSGIKTNHCNFILEPHKKIVIGCSGGPDSMALFDMLLKMREEYDLFLVCAHVNHNVRSESEEEERYLKEFCESHHVVFETMRIETYGDDNFHNEARNIRYHFFEETVYKYEADYLMTAHHADDLIETILMRIARGSNLKGYSGFQRIVQKDGYKIVRPLLSFTKQELEDYDQKNHVKYYIDSSNSKNKYTRNRYRKEVLPFLKKEDANVHKKFLKFSELLSDANSYILKETRKACSRVIKCGRLQIKSFLEEDLFLQKEILYQLLSEYYQDDLLLVYDKHIDLLYQLITSRRANLSYNFPNGVVAIKEYQECYLERKTDLIESYEIEFSEVAELPNGHIIKKVSEEDSDSNFICRLDSAEVVLPLCIRSRRLGDRMNVKGMTGSKKIKDIFINSKVNPKMRELWPVVVDARGIIVWLPGLKKSKFCKTKTESYDIIMKYR